MIFRRDLESPPAPRHPTMKKVAIEEILKAGRVVNKICKFRPPMTFEHAIRMRLKSYL